MNLDEIIDDDNDGRINNNDDWKKDPGQYARRIYEWWSSNYKCNYKNISSFIVSLRLIVLIQPSSCSIERVFSQLQYIHRACGNHILKSTLEMRTMMRYERGKGNDYGGTN